MAPPPAVVAQTSAALVSGHHVERKPIVWLDDTVENASSPTRISPRIDTISVGDATLSQYRVSPGRYLTRPPEGLGPRCSVSLAQSSGTVVINQATFHVRVGDLLLVDRTRPVEFVVSTSSIWLVFAFPHAMLSDRLSGLKVLPLMALRGTRPGAAQLQRAISSVWRRRNSSGGQDSAVLAEIQVNLLSAAIEEEAAANPAELLPLGQRLEISNAIRRNLGDPTFDGKALEAELAVSRRALKDRLGDVSPEDLIRRYRLAEARRLLRSGHSAHLSVAEICWRVGFVNASSFSTLYKDAFGVSPRQDR